MRSLRAEPGGHVRAPGSQLPEPRRVLAWLYLGRLVLLGVLVALVAVRRPVPALGAPWVAVLALLGLSFTGWSVLHARRRPTPPGEAFVQAQLVFDALLITAAVNLTGGQESVLAPVYVLLICAAALLLPFAGATLVGLLAIALYLLTAVTSTEGGVGAPVFLQAGLFAVVAFVTGYLGDRLRAAGAALGEARTELQQLRVDTGDILSTVSSGVLTVDGDGRLAFLNPAAEEILSLDAAGWTGRPILERLDRIAPGLGMVIARSANEGIAVRRFETERVGKDGFVLGVSTTVVEREGDARPAVTAVFQDITEKMRVEALRRRAERLEAVAELSASLAHEIKNPLASIRSAVEQLAGGVTEEDARVLGPLVVRESDRLSRLLTEFIDFARVKVTAPRPVDLVAVLRHAVELVRAHPDASDRAVELDVSAVGAHVWIRGAEDLMHRAILNLALNGVQWAGEGGQVRIAIDEVRSDLLSPALGALGLVRITIADSGPGIPADIAEHVFDPFFTRRPGGTGLGLALVQRALEAHGGAIFVDSGPPESGGATFTLYLPALPVELHATDDAGAEEPSLP